MSEQEARTIQPGDYITVTLDSDTGYFVIRQIEDEKIHISPLEDMETINTLIATDDGWVVEGAEDTPYEFAVFPAEEGIPTFESPAIEEEEVTLEIRPPSPITGIPMTPTTVTPIRPFQRTPMVKSPPVKSPTKVVSPVKTPSPVKTVSPTKVKTPSPEKPPVQRQPLTKVSRLLTGAAPREITPPKSVSPPRVLSPERPTSPVRGPSPPRVTQQPLTKVSRLLTGAPPQPTRVITPPKSASPPIQDIELIDDTGAADLCADIVSGRTRHLPQDKLSQLQFFAQNRNLNPPTATYGSQRSVCENILKVVLKTKYGQSESVLDRLSGQNLARQYVAAKETQQEDERRRQQAEDEERERQEIEERMMRRIEEARMLKESIDIARVEIIQDDLVNLRTQHLSDDHCWVQSKLSQLNLLPRINPELTGRRVRLPEEHWRLIFEPQPLLSNIGVQMALEDLGYDPLSLLDEEVSGILSQEQINLLVPPEPEGQAYLRINQNGFPIYAVISGFHFDEEILEVSEGLLTELGSPNNFVEVIDCHLKPVRTIELLLRRQRETPDVDEDTVKEELIKLIEDLGTLTVGDVIPVYLGENTLIYQVTRLLTNDGPTYAAGLPPAGGEVNLILTIESAEDFQAKLETKLDRSVDASLL